MSAQISLIRQSVTRLVPAIAGIVAMPITADTAFARRQDQQRSVRRYGHMERDRARPPQ